jgi:hypothetical protein
MTVVAHDFYECLARSHAQANAPFWFDIYRRAFPDLRAAVSVCDDGWGQRGGIDRVLTLVSGKTLWVDEKVRYTDYPDILLEYWSDKERRVRGWVAKDLACDYIAYAFIPSQTCYLLPFQPLRAAWRTNCDEWVGVHPYVEAVNDGYTSVGVAVPIRVLMRSLNDAMCVNWERPL